MNVGLLGAGRIGTFHARALVDMPEVTGLRIVDVDADHARRLAAAVGVQVAPSAGTLAEWADALVIATGSDTHAGLIHLAADARIPTFCEKPIALDLEATDAVLEHVQRAGIALQIGFMRRFDPGFREARRVVASGALGRLYIVRLTSHDPEPAHEPYIASSGGLFRDLSIHDFDILRWVTGQEVLEMYASGTVLADEVYARYDDVDTAVGTARLSEGTMAVFTATRHDPRGYDVRMELFGSEDTVTVGWDHRLAFRSLEPGIKEESQPGYGNFLERFAPAYRAELKTFLQLVKGKVANPCTGADAREALRIAIAADRSRREHRPVSIQEVTS